MRTFLSLLLLLAAGPARAELIAVYHTSDIHGWYSARPAAWDAANSTRPIGGFAALAAHLKKETTPYILLDSGDMWQGTPEGMLTKGLASAELMSLLGYSATVPGNHDYDYGEEPLRALAARASFPVLGANIYLKEDGSRPDYLTPHTLVQKAGRRLLVLGLAGGHTATSTRPENVKHLEFRDEAAETAAQMNELQSLQADAVIVLAHLGLDERFSRARVDISTWTLAPAGPSSRYIARAAGGIDLLLGGHNHTVLPKGWRDPQSGTMFGESGYGLSYVTRALLDFKDKGQLRGITIESIPLWTDVTGEDPAVLAAIAANAGRVEKAMGVQVGTATADLAPSPDWLDSGAGDWLCDLTRQVTGADLAFHNTKSIRAVITKGPVKLRHIYQAFPFDNNIVTMRLTGAQVKRALEDNIINGMSFIQVSGLEVEFRPGSDRRPDLVRVLRGGKEIGPEEEFSVAANDYLAGGGDGGVVFSGGKDMVNTMLTMRDMVRQAFEKGPVTPPPTGRIRKIQ